MKNAEFRIELAEGPTPRAHAAEGPLCRAHPGAPPSRRPYRPRPAGNEKPKLPRAHAATIGDILVGDHAEVKAKMRMGAYTAVRIEIEREDD